MTATEQRDKCVRATLPHHARATRPHHAHTNVHLYTGHGVHEAALAGTGLHGAALAFTLPGLVR